jgi:hypothetical protein
MKFPVHIEPNVQYHQNNLLLDSILNYSNSIFDLSNIINALKKVV